MYNSPYLCCSLTPAYLERSVRRGKGGQTTTGLGMWDRNGQKIK